MLTSLEFDWTEYSPKGEEDKEETEAIWFESALKDAFWFKNPTKSTSKFPEEDKLLDVM